LAAPVGHGRDFLEFSREVLQEAMLDGRGNQDRNEFLGLVNYVHPEALRGALWELLVRFRSDPLADLERELASGNFKTIKERYPSIFKQLKVVRRQQVAEIEHAIRSKDRSQIERKFPGLLRALESFGGKSESQRSRSRWHDAVREFPVAALLDRLRRFRARRK